MHYNVIYKSIGYKKSGFAFCSFRFANMHSLRKLNLVVYEKSLKVLKFQRKSHFSFENKILFSLWVAKLKVA